MELVCAVYQDSSLGLPYDVKTGACNAAPSFACYFFFTVCFVLDKKKLCGCPSLKKPICSDKKLCQSPVAPDSSKNCPVCHFARDAIPQTRQ